MHIALIPSWYPRYEGDPGGSFFREQAIALKRKLPTVGVFFPQLLPLYEFRPYLSKLQEVESIEDLGTNLVKQISFNITPRFEPGVAWQWLKQGWKAYLQYKQRFGRPDLIHAHCALYGGHLAKFIGSREDIPFVLTEHSTGYALSPLTHFQLNLANEVFCAASLKIAVSSQLQCLLEHKFSKSNSWITEPNIVDDPFFRVKLKSSEENDGVLRFLNVALLNHKKRHDLLLKAFAICKQTIGRPVHLSIAGDGPERNSIVELIKELGLEEDVTMLGLVPRSEMPSLMSRHDCFVLTSTYETFGVVLAEALACGLQCIATDCGGPSDIIGIGDGCIVPNGDKLAIASAMKKMAQTLEKPMDRNEIRKRCERRFGASAISDRLIQHYDKVLVNR